MKVIHKFEIDVGLPVHRISALGPSTALSIDLQHNVPMIWFEIDVDSKNIVTNFDILVVPTGSRFQHPDGYVFYKTLLYPSGLVFHFYVRTTFSES